MFVGKMSPVILYIYTVYISVEEFDISCFLFFNMQPLWSYKKCYYSVSGKETIEELFSLH